MTKFYTMTQEEFEAAVSNWLYQSGSYILDKFNDSFEPMDIKCTADGVHIYFEEIK